MSVRLWALPLAALATVTALGLSVLAGWQRGGMIPERLIWIAIGIVLVTSAHLLPALIRDAPIVIRGAGSLLWGACLVTACYGHAVFFAFAQQHAGELRVSTVQVLPVPSSARSLTTVMMERASVTAQLATANARYCTGNCKTLEVRRTTLAARLDALDAEAGDVRRRQTADDQVAAQRDALLADPVTTRLAALLGMTVSRVDLLTGLVFAAVLEGVACLLWTVALRLSPPAPLPVATEPGVAAAVDAADVTQPVVVPVTTGHAGKSPGRNTVTSAHRGTPLDDPVALPPATDPIDSDLAQLALDIAAGRVRPTVAAIRIHLGCSQAKAVLLRRRLHERTAA